jgi:hypothetical protein
MASADRRRGRSLLALALDERETTMENETTVEHVKQRHGCLTAWLVLMVIANTVTALSYLLGSQMMRGQFPEAPGWAFPLMGLLGILNVVFAVALLAWKKWGFWGFCASAGVAFVANVSIGFGVGPSLMGLVGIAILYGVLHIGGEKKGWTQLE